jgi:hypothetical protein
LDTRYQLVHGNIWFVQTLLYFITYFFFFRGKGKTKFTSHETKIEILFKNPNFLPSILQQQLSTLDFVSYCGGSLGLFLGFSVVSAVEIVYYLSIRLLFLRNQKKKVDSEFRPQEKRQKCYLMQVIENSSIHGFNQFSAKNQHGLEK